MKRYKKIMLYSGITLLISILCILLVRQGGIFKGTQPDLPAADNDEKIYASLRIPGHDTEEYVLSEITLENAREALKKIDVKDDFYWSNTISRFMDNKVVKNANVIWKNDDKYRVEIDGTVKKVIIHDGNRTLIKNNTRATEKLIEGDVDFSYNDQIGVADISYFMNDSENVLVTTKLARGEIGNIIYIEFIYEKFDQREEFYISVDYGVIISAKTYINDVLSYELSTEEFIPDYSSDDTLFDITQ